MSVHASRAKRVPVGNTYSLPRYAVLVALYKEAASVPKLLRHLAALQYPSKLVTFYFLLEADDRETMSAFAEGEELWSLFRWNAMLVTVPAPVAGEQQTKPRALNHGLEIASEDGADLVVVYDAEDEPAPDQLLRAAEAFHYGPKDLAAVQARLAYWNASDSWIARMFAAEYLMWFGYLVRGLCHLGMPVPLGGTSNHIRVSVLRDLGGWDADNVTEDCELGLRLYAHGHRVDFLDSVTLEEACFRPWPWIKQRTRWTKGYMWTWFTSIAPGGWRGQLSWHLFVLGTPLVALINPWFWLVFVAWAAGADVAWLCPYEWEWWLAMTAAVVGNGVSVFLPARAFWEDGHRRAALACLSKPLYWLLHSVAAYRALYQIFVDRKRWEKTEHAVSPSHGGRP